MATDDAKIARYMEYLVGRALGEDGVPTYEASLTPIESIATQLETALRHQDAGTRLPGPTRFAWLKRWFLRMLRLQADEQAAFNRATVSALLMMNHNLTVLPRHVDPPITRLRAALTALDALQRELTQQADRLHERVVTVETRLVEVARFEAMDRTDIAVQRARLNHFLEATANPADDSEDDGEQRMKADASAWLAPLYSQLEEAFRGSRDDITERLRSYLPDVLALDRSAPIIDIGCGRGEWIELLSELGIHAYGVDNNKTFVEQDGARGLDVLYEDAITHLLSLEPSSAAAITAFHLVEHLSFEDVVRLTDAALVALRPGGVLIFETPNPTNLVVGSAAFYLDPTHRNPIHPLFLQFLVEARGFSEVELRFLHPVDAAKFPAPEDRRLRMVVDYLNQALFGPQDYAVIGHKAARQA